MADREEQGREALRLPEFSDAQLHQMATREAQPPTFRRPVDVEALAKVIVMSVTQSDSIEGWEGWQSEAAAILASDWMKAHDAEVAAAAWDEGAEATAEWMWNNPSPDGTPHDPPRNPYRADESNPR